MLRSCGINVNCLPLLDVRQEGASDIIGDRALGSEPMQVAALGRVVLDGMASAGVVGVIKHIPGHGRALVDSHKELPVVSATSEELETDLEPFERLSWAPMGMTAHVVYTAWDPDHPASMSATVIGDIIRGRIGFDGWLMSDDIGMEALAGDFGSRAAGVVAAGCDVGPALLGQYGRDGRSRARGPGHERGRRRAACAGHGIDDDRGLKTLDFAQEIAKRDTLLALV